MDFVIRVNYRRVRVRYLEVMTQFVFPFKLRCTVLGIGS